MVESVLLFSRAIDQSPAFSRCTGTGQSRQDGGNFVLPSVADQLQVLRRCTDRILSGVKAYSAPPSFLRSTFIYRVSIANGKRALSPSNESRSLGASTFAAFKADNSQGQSLFHLSREFSAVNYQRQLFSTRFCATAIRSKNRATSTFEIRACHVSTFTPISDTLPRTVDYEPRMPHTNTAPRQKKPSMASAKSHSAKEQTYTHIHIYIPCPNYILYSTQHIILQ